MHIAIIDLCYKLFNTNKKCVFIIEEDYYVQNIYGELDIIERHFKLKNILKYNNES